MLGSSEMLLGVNLKHAGSSEILLGVKDDITIRNWRQYRFQSIIKMKTWPYTNPCWVAVKCCSE